MLKMTFAVETSFVINYVKELTG